MPPTAPSDPKPPAAPDGPSLATLRGGIQLCGTVHVGADVHGCEELLLLGRIAELRAVLAAERTCVAAWPREDIVSLLRVCVRVRSVEGVRVLCEVMQRVGMATDHSAMKSARLAVAAPHHHHAWPEGMLELMAWAVHARVAWNWALLHVWLENAPAGAVADAVRVQLGAEWAADAHASNVPLMDALAAALPWAPLAGDVLDGGAVLAHGVQASERWVLREDGSNLERLIVYGRCDLLRIALAGASVDDSGAVWEKQEPRNQTTRMALSVACVVRDKPGCLGALCEADARALCVWHAFSDLDSLWCALRCPALEAACRMSRAACMRVLVASGVLATFLAADAAERLRDLFHSVPATRTDATAATLGVLVEGVPVAVAHVPFALFEEHVANAEVCRALVTLSRRVAAAAAATADGGGGCGVSGTPARLEDAPLFRVCAAEAGSVALLDALAAEGVDFGTHSTCTEDCLTCTGGSFRTWGECGATWGGATLLGLSPLLCLACAPRIACTWWRGALVQAARRSHSADAVAWVRAARARGGMAPPVPAPPMGEE